MLMKRTIGTLAYMGGLQCNLEAFTWAWGQMIQYNNEYLCQPGEIVHLAKSTVSFHSFARNSIAEQALGEWTLMLDMDHAPEPDLCVRLVTVMRKLEADVVIGVYCHRTPPHSPVLYLDADEEKPGYFAPVGEWDPSVVAFEVASAGAGALLVKNKVFQRIRDELKEGPFDVVPPFGEDHSFFQRCRKLGIKLLACPGIESPHLVIRELRVEDYEPANAHLQPRRNVAGYAQQGA